MYKYFLKRIFDILLSAFAIIVFLPLFAVVALLVRIKLGSPVIFVQERPGKIDRRTGKEKTFKMYKFRTMNEKKDEIT